MEHRQKMPVLHSVFVMMSSCFTTIFGAGILFSFGIFFPDIMATFGGSRAETAVIQSTLVSVFLLSGFMAGMLIKKFGARNIGIFGSLLFSLSLQACFFASSVIYLVISIGVLNGIGLSTMYICATTVIGHHFSGKRRFLLVSVQITSGALGGMVYPYLLRYLSDMFGWKGALLLIGAVSLNALPCCIIWKPPSKSKKQTHQEINSAQIAKFQDSLQVETKFKNCVIIIRKTKETGAQVSDSIFALNFPVFKGDIDTKTVIVKGASKNSLTSCLFDSNLGVNMKSILCNSCIMSYAIGLMLATPYINFIIIFVGDIYNDNGLTSDDVSFGLFLLNLFGVFGRLLPGILLQFRFTSTLFLPLLCSLISAVLLISYTFVYTRLPIFILTAMFGIPIGMFRTIVSVVTLRLVGKDLLPIAVGLIFTFNGIINVVSAPLNGLIRDLSGSYSSIFYTGTGVQLLAAFVFFLASICRRNKKHKISQKSTIFYITNF